jgi:hypothetical protein
VCTHMGAPKTWPPALHIDGYAANGDANYAGLCSMACNLGFCPSEACSPNPRPPYIPTVSPFNPPACINGTGIGTFAGLCSYGCYYGFCPIHHCSCIAQGGLNKPPPVTVQGPPAISLAGDDAGLCEFTCSRGYCPEPCSQTQSDHITFDSTCSTEQQAEIKGELGYAQNIAKAASSRSNIEEFSTAYEQYFAQSLRENPTSDFIGKVINVSERMADMLQGSEAYPFSITCINSKGCKAGRSAEMIDGKKTMNVCPKFFQTKADDDPENTKVHVTSERHLREVPESPPPNPERRGSGARVCLGA